MNNMTAASLAEIFKRSSNDPVLRLLELEHALWSPTIVRFVDQPKAVSNAGGSNQTYQPLGFMLEPPSDLSEILRVQLVIDNTQRTMMSKIRSIVSKAPAKVTFKLVLASAPNTVILPPWVFEARQAQYNATGLNLTCLFNVLAAEVVPMHVMNPARNPGLYKETE